VRLIINTDGGGQSGADVGGKAAAAYVVATEEGLYLGSRSKTLTGTNNDAEFTGVLMALQDLATNEILPLDEIEHVKFISDSQLTVFTIRGDWRCKADNLRVHRDQIHSLLKGFGFQVEFTWQRREHNTNADRLCAAAMEYGGKTDFFAPMPSDPRKSGRSKKDGKRAILEPLLA
jgi:ribonuclease HI